MTAHQRISDKPFKQQIAAFGPQIYLQTRQCLGTTALTRCKMVGRLLARIQHFHRKTRIERQDSCDHVPQHHPKAKQSGTLELGHAQDGRVGVEPNPAAPAQHFQW